MRKEIKELLGLIQNPLADQNRINTLKSQISWWDTSSMSAEEKQAMDIIYRH